jgi:hypothetical protein
MLRLWTRDVWIPAFAGTTGFFKVPMLWLPRRPICIQLK